MRTISFFPFLETKYLENMSRPLKKSEYPQSVMKMERSDCLVGWILDGSEAFLNKNTKKEINVIFDGT